MQGGYYPPAAPTPPPAPPTPPPAPPIHQYYTPPLPVVRANFQVQQGQVPSQWTTGICYSCFNSCEDFNLCCLTCWCPCVTFGRIAQIVDRGTMSCASSGATYCLICYFTGFEWIYAGLNRSKLRVQYGLSDETCPDLLLHFFVHKCALRQEYRELRLRGFDMKLGWNADGYRMQEQKAAAVGRNVPPTVQGGMTR